MDKKDILALVLIVGPVMDTGCSFFGKTHWTGWVSRPVVVSVIDEDKNHPISGAAVKLVPAERMKSWVTHEGLKYVATTDVDGVAALIAEFDAGGEYSLWGEKGRFGLDGAGALQITAEGYRGFEEPLVSLVGQESLPTQDESPIRVTVHLTKQD